MTKSFKSLEKLERELRKEINKAIVDTINKFYSELKDNLNKKKLTSQIEDAIEISFENNKGIIEGNVKINEVAYEYGFEEYSTFYRNYIKIIGKPPYSNAKKN